MMENTLMSEMRPPRQRQQVKGLMEKRTVAGFEQYLWFLIFFLGFGGFFISLYIAVLVYIPSRLVIVPFRGTILVVSLLLIIALLAKQKMYKGWLWIPIIGLFLLYSARIFVDGYLRPKPMQDDAFTLFLLTIGASLIPMAALMSKVSWKTINFGRTGFLLGYILTALMTVFLYRDLLVHGGGRLRGGAFVGDHVAISPLLVSYMGAALIAVGISLLFLPSSRGVIWRRVVPVLSVSCGLGPFLIGASRGAVVALLVCAGFMLGARLRKGQLAKGLALGVLSLVTAGLILLAAQEAGSGVVNRFMRIGEQIQYAETGAARLYIWENAIRAFLSAPLFGVALDPRGVGSHPHNLILEAFAATGFLGGICILMIYGSGVMRAFFILKNNPEFHWIAVVFLTYMTYSLFSSSIGTLPLFWMAFGGVISVSELLGYSQRQTAVKQRIGKRSRGTSIGKETVIHS